MTPMTSISPESFHLLSDGLLFGGLHLLAAAGVSMVTIFVVALVAPATGSDDQLRP